jgi:hypothetical protein
LDRYTGTILEEFYKPVFGEGIVQEASFLLFYRRNIPGSVLFIFFFWGGGRGKEQYRK